MLQRKPHRFACTAARFQFQQAILRNGFPLAVVSVHIKHYKQSILWRHLKARAARHLPRSTFLCREQNLFRLDPPVSHHRVNQFILLILSRQKLLTQSLVDPSLRPNQMHRSVRREPQIAQCNPAARRVDIRKFSPITEFVRRYVRIPSIKQPPERVVPLLPSFLFFENAPLLVRFHDIARSAKVDRSIPDRHIRVTKPDRLSILHRPLQLPLRLPFPFAIQKAPLRVCVFDILE